MEEEKIEFLELTDEIYENGVEIYSSKIKNIGLGILALIMSLMGLMFIFVGEIAMTIIGIVCFTFFMACFVMIIKNVGKKAPLLILTKDGFTNVHQSYSKEISFIPWKRVKEISMREIAGQEFVCVDIENEDEYVESMSKVMKLGAKSNLKMGFPVISISANGLKRFNSERLFQMFAVFYNKYNGIDMFSDELEDDVDNNIEEDE